MGKLEGRVAVVTGAGTGIGVGIARALGRAGARLVLSAYHSMAGAEALAEELRAAGIPTVALESDFRRAGNARAVVTTALDEFGQLDILINNAGYTLAKPFLECHEADWEDVLNINLKSMYVTCQAALPHMVERRHGRIINISSVHSASHTPNRVIYGTTKGAVNAFTRALAVDFAGYGITVNVIVPGAIHVERDDRAGTNLDAVAASIPAGAWGTPGDIGAAALYLASDEAGYVNGALLVVDGALDARMATSP